MVDWDGGVFAGCLPRVQLFVSTCNGRPHLALQQHWLLSINCHFDDCKAWLVRFPPCKTRYIRIPRFSILALAAKVNFKITLVSVHCAGLPRTPHGTPAAKCGVCLPWWMHACSRICRWTFVSAAARGYSTRFEKLYFSRSSYTRCLQNTRL